MSMARVWAALAALAVGPAVARADVTHTAQVSHIPPGGTTNIVSDAAMSPGALPPPRDVRATLTGPTHNVESATGSSGDFGNAGQIIGPPSGGGRIDAINVIDYSLDDSIRNVSSTPQMARGGFLIEGGSAEVGPDSVVTFRMLFSFTIFDPAGNAVATPDYSEGFNLQRPSTGNAAFSQAGDDGTLGAAFDGVRRVDVPLAFREFDIGLVPPMGYVSFNFRFDAIGIADPTGDASATWRYADPLSINGPGPSPSTTVTIIPEPAAAASTALAALAAAATRRRR